MIPFDIGDNETNAADARPQITMFELLASRDDTSEP